MPVTGCSSCRTPGTSARRLLEASGFEALATTSAGLAWSLGKLDGAVSRAELVEHVASSQPRPAGR